MQSLHVLFRAGFVAVSLPSFVRGPWCLVRPLTLVPGPRALWVERIWPCSTTWHDRAADQGPWTNRTDQAPRTKDQGRARHRLKSALRCAALQLSLQTQAEARNNEAEHEIDGRREQIHLHTETDPLRID